MAVLDHSADHSAMRVVVAEDSPDTRRTHCLLLKSWDYDVRDAENGLEALRLAKAFSPEVVNV